MAKRVLVVGLSKNRGGVEAFFHNYYCKMNLRKYHFDFLSFDGDVAFGDEYRRDGARVFNVPNPHSHPLKYNEAVRKIILDGKYDVVHVNMLSAANMTPIKMALKADIKKIIVHSHNAGTPKGVIRKILHLINRRRLNDNRLVKLACSEKAGYWLFGKNADFQVINNAIDAKKYRFSRAERAEVRRKYGIGDDEFLIGNVGRLCEQKNQQFLVELLSKMNKKYKLMIVGDGDRRNQLEELAKKYGVFARLIIVPNVEDIKKYYSAMDAFLFPSLFEGLPLAPIEAYANGLQLMLSEEITREIDMGSASVFLPLKIENWKKYVTDFDFEPRDRKINIPDKFNIAKQAKMLENIYDGKVDGEMKISVIIPAYNSEKYIEKSIKSILHQTYQNIELIVVDDGSTDDTLKKINGFKDDERLLVVHQKNSGANIARCSGVKKATGDYCIFVDVDDWIELDGIEKLVNYTNAFAPDIIKFNAVNEPSGKEYARYDLGKQKYKVLSKTESIRVLLSTPLLHELAFNLYRTSLLKAAVASFEQRLSFGEDFYVNLDVVPMSKRYLFVYDVIYHYTKDNPNSTSSTTKLDVAMRNLDDAIIVNRRLFDKLRLLGDGCAQGMMCVVENLLWPLYQIGNLRNDTELLDIIDRVSDLDYMQKIGDYYNGHKKQFSTVRRGLGFALFHGRVVTAFLKHRRKSVLKYIRIYNALHGGRR